MKTITAMARALVPGLAACVGGATILAAQNPLSSWNEGLARASILEFVAAVTDDNGEDYVEPAKRIAVFDNDGTFHFVFALDRVKALAVVPDRQP